MGKMKKIGIIGFGNMGSAFAKGLIKQNYSVAITDAKKERTNIASDKYGLKVFLNNKELLSFTDILILAVKPQEMKELINEIKFLCSGKRIISIIAGRSIKSIYNELKESAAIARFMPNLAAGQGKALVGVSFDLEINTSSFRQECLDIAAAIGTPCEIPESLMPAITGLSGSGIAFAFSFIHAMALGGVSAGISYTKALEIVLATVDGAVSLVKKGKGNPIEWLSRITSPAGTTIEGVAELEKNRFTYGVMNAVQKAAQRAKELED